MGVVLLTHKFYMKPCYCCSGNQYADCCQPYINLQKIPDTPLQLMRSRYTAYVIGDKDYLLATWFVASRPDKKSFKIDAELHWESLKIIESSDDMSNAEGAVEFIASYVTAGNYQQHHERSRFVFDKGKWFYAGSLDIM